jgi:hypothetical protein
MNTRTLYLLHKPSAIPNLIDKPHVKINHRKKKKVTKKGRQRTAHAIFAFHTSATPYQLGHLSSSVFMVHDSGQLLGTCATVQPTPDYPAADVCTCILICMHSVLEHSTLHMSNASKLIPWIEYMYVHGVLHIEMYNVSTPYLLKDPKRVRAVLRGVRDRQPGHQ